MSRVALIQQPPLQQQQPPLQMYYQYYVCKWQNPDAGFFLDWGQTSLTVIGTFTSKSYIDGSNGIVSIPVDPITAVSLGAVTPDQLEWPPGLAGAFHLLKG